MTDQNIFNNKPLSKRMLPTKLKDFVGQEHLVGPSRPIRIMIENKLISSMIFYGPPATGKTSLAEIISNEINAHFIKSNALTIDIDEIKNVINKAKLNAQNNIKTIYFIDEIHRLYKPKQDALLSSIEEGEIILIGATTENPYFVLTPALRSRIFIYEFKNLNYENKLSILEKALREDSFLKNYKIELDQKAKEYLINFSNDPRRMLDTLEITILSKLATNNGIIIEEEDFKNILQNITTNYSDTEGHYDYISAFIKSVRGSDINASMYYLAYMLENGEDPLFIARRLLILSAEDIGLSYPEALVIANACYDAVEKIGMPEARIILANTTALLTLLPKSNSSYIALEKAIEFIKNGNILNVPSHLRESHFYGAKSLNRGVDYKYPHDYKNHYVKQKYLEKELKFFEFGNLGFERKLKEWFDIITSSEN